MSNQNLNTQLICAIKLLEQYEAIVTEELLPNIAGIFIKDFQRINETLMGHTCLKKSIAKSELLTDADIPSNPPSNHQFDFECIKETLEEHMRFKKSTENGTEAAGGDLCKE